MSIGLTTAMEWFVMRDLKRPNAKVLAYEILEQKGFEVFTPLKWTVEENSSGKIRKQVPVVRDLLFVHSCRANLDPIIDKTPSLQYRFAKGQGYRSPMTIPTKEMEKFMEAYNAALKPRFFSPEEITSEMLGKKVHVIGGPLNNFEGKLLKIRGSRVKRLLVELPGMLAIAVEVCPDYIEYIC